MVEWVWDRGVCEGETRKGDNIGNVNNSNNQYNIYIIMIIKYVNKYFVSITIVVVT